MSIEALSELRQSYDEARMLPRRRAAKTEFSVGQIWEPTKGAILRDRTIIELNEARVGYQVHLKCGKMKQQSVTIFTWQQWIGDYDAVCKIPAVSRQL